MSKTDELSEAVLGAIPESDLVWPGDDAVASDIARAIVSTLPVIDRETVKIVQHYARGGLGFDADMEELAEALTAILDLAEADR